MRVAAPTVEKADGCKMQNVNQPTKGSIEAQIAGAVVRFHREQQGRGPEEVRAHLLGDMVIVRCSGVFTPTEFRLAESEEGRRLIRSSRKELRSINKDEIEQIVGEIAGASVMRSYSDIDPDAAEVIEVYVLDSNAELNLARRSDA